MKFLIVAVFIAIIAAVARSEGDAPTKFKTEEHSGSDVRDKLLDHLFNNYKKENYPENATINFGISILDVDFDIDRNLMNSNIWIRAVWTDSRFSWDSKATGISVMRVPADKIWLPDVVLFNGIHDAMDCFKTNALIYPNGNIIWVPPCQLISFCNLTLTQHPYEEQECMMKFGSWTFDGLTMGLEFYDKKTLADTDYFSSGKYTVTKNVAVREEKKYDCCAEPYLSLRYDLGFTRRPKGVCAAQ